MKKQNLGFIGTGVMGQSMCNHLLAAGHRLSIHTRSRDKAVKLIEQGAQWCETPMDVAAQSNIIFSIVGFPRDVRQVLLGADGILSGVKEKSIIVDMTTSSPALAREISEAAKQHDVSALDAPVSGGDVGAKEGTLAIMVGGDKMAYERVLPFFRIMGRNIALMGAAGSGQHTKMSNQILIASTMVGVVESLLYAHKAGLDPDQVIDVIGKGAASSWSINNLGRRIVKGDFNPGFFIKHFVKDMGIALDEAKQMNLSLPGLALAHQFYIAAKARGLENLGTQGLYQVLSHMNGV